MKIVNSMATRFETLGNATVLVSKDGKPVLATDPWLVNTCYFGSWALDHPLSQRQISDIIAADTIWISHGHPDHLHDESLAMLRPETRILLPDHYSGEIAEYLRGKGFAVTVLPYRTWFPIAPGIRVLCLDNMNQDAVLAIEADGSLVIDLNDSPLCGEERFLRKLIGAYPRDRTYLLALCSVDADMFNFVDATGASLAGPPDERKPGAVWHIARIADRLGVGTFCCSSSQHIYVRSDSVWANPYRITWTDMQKYWSRRNIRLVEPFVTVDLATGTCTANHPSHQSDESQITEATGDDDWAARLSAEEWTTVERFVRKFEMVRRHIDFVAFQVGGETRRFELNPGVATNKACGVVFNVPRQSLLTTVEFGYLDDLLIGNFMKVELVNTRLYPRFTPLVAKVGGNAKVYSKTQYRGFLLRYLRRNPLGTVRYLLGIELDQVILPWLRRAAERLGIKQPLKYIYRRVLGDPVGQQS